METCNSLNQGIEHNQEVDKIQEQDRKIGIEVIQGDLRIEVNQEEDQLVGIVHMNIRRKLGCLSGEIRVLGCIVFLVIVLRFLLLKEAILLLNIQRLIICLWRFILQFMQRKMDEYYRTEKLKSEQEIKTYIVKTIDNTWSSICSAFPSGLQTHDDELVYRLSDLFGLLYEWLLLHRYKDGRVNKFTTITKRENWYENFKRRAKISAITNGESTSGGDREPNL
ncbi:hypothetical protein PGB90_009555 [Kerria lacca]